MYPQRTLRHRRRRTAPAVATQSSAASVGPTTPLTAAGTPGLRLAPQAQPVPTRTAIESFRGHIDALYMMALLGTGDDRHAEEAVVDALVAASADPSVTSGDLSSVWRCLASHFRFPNEQTVVRGSIAATVRMAGLSPLQRQSMALFAVGRDIDDVATLLHIRPAQVRVEFRTGAAALDAALQSLPAPTAKHPSGDCLHP
jgi:hypothetical protein